jgi:hypothetical protein
MGAVGKAEIWIGDAREVLQQLPAGSHHAAICDPPHGVGMTKTEAGRNRRGTWDDDTLGFESTFWQLLARTLRPGATIAVFLHARSMYRMGVAIEAGGFQITDTIAHIHGSGMSMGSIKLDKELRMIGAPEVLAGAYEGWETALRPAVSHTLIGRNLAAGVSLSRQIAAGGHGGYNLSAVKVKVKVKVTVPATDNRSRRPGQLNPESAFRISGRAGVEKSTPRAGGRHPSNVILEHAGACGETCVEGCPIAVVREQGRAARPGRGEDASRFDNVLHHPIAGAAERLNVPGENGHLTPKSLAVADWVIDAISEVEHKLIDPTAGSGALMESGVRLGRNMVGIEIDRTNLSQIQRRMDRAGAELTIHG